MRTQSLLVAFSLVLLLHSSSSQLFGSAILLLSSGDSSNNSAIQSVLQAAGNTVTIGPTYNTFTGAGLSGYNAVFLNPSGTFWNALNPPGMTQSGQQALVNFVSAGGGLVIGGNVMEINKMVDPSAFSTLQAANPATALQADTLNSPISFSGLTTNSVINASLPSTFSFTASGYTTETEIAPKTGATAFFATNQWTTTFGGEGVGYGTVGWNYFGGRVVSLSTFSDNTELGNASYDQMLTNSFNYVTEAAVPEPSTLAVFGAGCLAFAIVIRMRSRVSGCDAK